MRTYLVGGAVRDSLLGQPVRERDYVVVGSQEQDMLDAGFRPVGRDFPVFLHPQTHEEYALARTERKVAPGHQGFVCHASPDVTLEEDLLRRDLTVNAIAQDNDGNLIDPFGGQADLEARLLRHVSEAFSEDPLRVLRLARFLALLTPQGFRVHPETLTLVSTMVSEGHLGELTAERVLLETDKALATAAPHRYFSFLAEIGAAEVLWPQISSAGIDRLLKLPPASPDVRFACLVMDLPEAEIRELCKRLKCSNQRQDMSLLIARDLQTWQRVNQMSAAEITRYLYQLDAIRKSARFEQFSEACEIISGMPLKTRWLSLQQIVLKVSAKDVARDLKGPDIGQAIKSEQINRLKTFLND